MTTLAEPAHARVFPARRIVALAAAGVATVVVAGVLLWPSSSPVPASPVRTALAFDLADVRSGTGSAALSTHPGQPVVLNFFAAWCDPCHAEVPLLASLHDRMGPRVEVIGVDVQDNRDLAAQLLSDAKATYPAGYDPARDVSGAWGVDGLPVTVFIAADGTVIDYHRGELRSADLDRRVRTLLARSAAGK